MLSEIRHGCGFDMAGARIIVPAIVVAEFYYVTLRAGPAVPPSELLEMIESSRDGH